jgi:hypothetical protein
MLGQNSSVGRKAVLEEDGNVEALAAYEGGGA